jgi:hypothetical protein
MIDTDDVLLLRPAGPGTGLGPLPIPPPDTAPGGRVVVRVYPAELADRAPRGELASFVTEPAENTFAGLPVRADALVYVTLDPATGPGSTTSGPRSPACPPPPARPCAADRAAGRRV